MKEIISEIGIQSIATVQILLQQAIVLRISKVDTSVLRLILATVLLQVSEMILACFTGIFSVSVILTLILLLTLSYRFIFGQTFRISFFMSLGQILLGVCVEYVAQLLSILFGRDFYELFYEDPVYIRLCITILLLLIYLLVRYRNIWLIPTVKGRTGRLWTVYLLYLILFTMPVLAHIETNKQIFTSGAEVYNLVLFVAFFLYNIIYINNLNRMSDISARLEVERLYAGTMEKSVAELRGFKHDFANIINTVGGYVSMEDWEDLKDYMSSLNTEFLKLNTTDIANSQLKQSPMLYSVVLSKLSLAEFQGIDFRISIQCEIHLEYCSLLDFSRIIGILLDNALDAAMESDEKTVDLEIVEKHGQYCIMVRNSCRGEVDIGRIFEAGVTNKKDHTGLGLHNVHAIIERYKKRGYAMELSTSCDDKLFMQILTV